MASTSGAGAGADSQASAAAAGGASSFIGALISLLSRSDIRYQGFLNSIDSAQATIALEKVRSWGTEGRLAKAGKPNEELPPNENVYDFIVFRAADVKDLKIDDPHPDRSRPPPPLQQALQDPAILGSSGPPAQYGSPYGRPPPPGQMYGMPPPPPPGAYGGPGGPYGYGPPMHVGPGGGMARPPFPNNAQQPPPPPQFGSAPSPAPAPVPAPPANTAPTKQSPVKTVAPAASGLPSKPVAAQQQPAPAKKPDVAEKKSVETTDTVAEHLSKLSMQGQGNVPSDNQLPAAPRGASGAQRGRGGGARTVPGSDGRQRANQASVFDQPRGAANGRAIEVPDSDFDFDASNAKFEKGGLEAAQQDGKDKNVLDSIPPAAEEQDSFYDKSSFFDNISSEVKERYELRADNGAARGGPGGFRGGGRGRQDRIAEERRNMDTFGEVGNDNGYRGRGRGSGRGRGRGRGRGGYRGGPQGGTPALMG